jgi:hypothetical protein
MIKRYYGMKKVLLIVWFVCINYVILAQNEKITEIQIPKSMSSPQKLKLSDIALDVEYIPLETTKNCIIGNNCSCTLTNDYIFISQHGGLLQFRKDGKFVRQVNKVGQGPDECHIRCCAFDEKNKCIYMVNNYTSYIMIFGFDGKFKRKFKNPFEEMIDYFVWGIECDKSGNLLFPFDNKRYKYIVTDSCGKIFHKEINYDFYPVEKKNGPGMVILGYSPFYFHQNNTYYKYQFNDTVYNLNQKYECIPSYVIKIPDKLTQKQSAEFVARVLSISDIMNRYEFKSVYETKQYLFINFTIIGSTEDNYFLYDKQQNKLTNIEPEFVNNIDGGVDVRGVKYTLLWPFEMKRKLTSAHFAKTKVLYPEKQKALKELVNRLDDEDNPVLMIVKLK